MKIKYGKPYGDIAKFKENFVSDNEKFLRENQKIEEVYSLGLSRGVQDMWDSHK